MSCASVVGLALLASATLGTPAAAASDGGGTVFVAKPEVTKVSCLRKCASRHRAQGGSTVKIAGDELEDVTAVVFMGSTGRADDAHTKVRSGSSKRVQAKVPIGAVTGPVSVVTAAGVHSPRTSSVAILPPPPPAPNAQLSPVPGVPLLQTGTSRTRVFIGARRAVSFSYSVAAAAPVSVQVQLVRASDGVAVKSWTPPPAVSGQVGTVTWSGTLGSAGATPGRYSFRLTAAGPTGVIARSAQLTGTDRDAFDLYDHLFPVQGAHDFGGSAGRFGARRSGHRHQGQDILARCGLPILAARGGRVQYAGYHSAAGYYVVIDGTGTGEDNAYMHLAQPSPFKTGDRVYTGQWIGSVGDTGDARGCHLHFESWSAPGWYEGGRPFDPLPSLRAWDAWS